MFMKIIHEPSLCQGRVRDWDSLEGENEEDQVQRCVPRHHCVCGWLERWRGEWLGPGDPHQG